jgi:hypothetical protein
MKPTFDPHRIQSQEHNAFAYAQGVAFNKSTKTFRNAMSRIPTAAYL